MTSCSTAFTPCELPGAPGSQDRVVDLETGCEAEDKGRMTGSSCRRVELVTAFPQDLPTSKLGSQG